MEVVRTYEDSGKSGLTLTNRSGLQQLLADVLSPEVRFKAVVVLDVSRWGRFQDVDESAFYEYLCRRAGVDVLYCAEPFSEVAGPMGVIIKSVKRAMAAEYSRELSAKVYAGQSLKARKGYHVCGNANFGLKRVQVTENGTVVRDLPMHEHKSRQDDHVELAAGDPLECALVRMIFSWFVHSRMSAPEIALRLNWNCYPGRHGLTPWRREYVLLLLANEKYVGTTSYGKLTQKLRTRPRCVPREKWIVIPNSFEPVVSREDFDEAQRLRHVRRKKWSDEDLLNFLRQSYEEFGYVNSKVLFERTKAPGTAPYQQRFGSIADACKLAGVPPTPHMEVTSLRSKQRQAHKLRLLEWLDERYGRMGIGFYWHPYNRRACVEGALTMSVRIAHAQNSHGSQYWELSPDHDIGPDVCVFIRVARGGESVIDYFVVPGNLKRHYFINSKGVPTQHQIERFRCSTLEDVFRRLEVARNWGAMRMPTMLRQRRRGTAVFPRVQWR